MRRSLLTLALGAVLSLSFARAEASPAPVEVEGSSLMKRTNSGGLNYCVPGAGLKMAFYNGGCSCKSRCGSHETECAGPTNGHGQGACSSKGCTIVCDQGYTLSGRKCNPTPCGPNEERDRNGSCVCIPGCGRHPTTKGCQPACKANESWESNKCVCKAPFAVNYKGECVKPPTCAQYEQWNGKDCVCMPSCGKNKKNKCEPQCPANSYWSNNKCKCYDGFLSKNGQCIPKCGDNAEWCDKTNKCKCKDGFESVFGICKPACPNKNETYNPKTKKCECIPGCFRGKKNVCEPEPPKCPKPNEVYDPKTKKCVCKPGCWLNKDKCEPNPPPPTCPKPNEVYDPVTKKCICKPGCHWWNDKCEPIGPSQKPKPKPPVGGHPHFGIGHGGPHWTHKHHTREEDALFCPDGLKACPISQTLGGYECVDTKEELENCGGCAALGEGTDCTALPGVSGVGCNAGKCVVFSCKDSFRMSASGKCVAGL